MGLEFLDEFRRGVDRIVTYPNGWQIMGATYRRYRLQRFPYGILYRIESATEIVIVAVMHLQRHPDAWRYRMS